MTAARRRLKSRARTEFLTPAQGIEQLLADVRSVPGTLQQGALSAYDFLEEDPERAALLGALVSPDPYVGTTAGITEAFGYYPNPFNPDENLPSVAGSIREGDYVGAGLTSLGAIPIFGSLFGAAKAARLAKAKQLADKKKAADEGVPAEQIEMDLGETPEPEPELAPNEQLRQELNLGNDPDILAAREQRKKTKQDRQTFPPEASQNMEGQVQKGPSSGQAKSQVEDNPENYSSGESSFLRTRSNLGNALFNTKTLLQIGEEGLSPAQIKKQLKRMNVSQNEMDASGITGLLKENDLITLEQLRNTYQKYAPKLKVIRPHVKATDATNKQHQRWLPMPGDYSRMIDPESGEIVQKYNVTDYEELVYFNDVPESDSLYAARRDTGSHREYDRTQDSEFIRGRIGHSRGSVVTEFDDPIVNADFPNGAYVIEEIQSDLSKRVVPIKEGGDVRQQLMLRLNSAEQLGRDRMKDFNEILQDDEVMHEISSLINVEHEFNTGAFDFAPDARIRLNNQPRDKTAFDDPENIEEVEVQKLNNVFAYLNGSMSEKAFLAQNTLDETNFGKHIVAQKKAGKITVPSSKLGDALEKMNAVVDSKRDIKTLRNDLTEEGDTVLLNADTRRKIDEVVEPYIERMGALFQKKQSLADEAAAGRVPKSIEVLESKNPEIQAKLKQQMAASDEFDAITDQLDEAAKQLQRDDPEAFELLSALKPELVSPKVMTDTKLISDQPRLLNDFPFASETDYIKHVVDTIVQKAQAKGLSGVIVPSWEEIARLRGVREDSSAWNRYRETYKDTVSKRFKELEKQNPESKYMPRVNINSPLIDKVTNPNHPAIGYTFAPLSSNQKVDPPPLALAKGGEVKVHKGIGAMAREVL